MGSNKDNNAKSLILSLENEILGLVEDTIPHSSFSLDTNLMDVGLDSISLMDLSMKIYQKYYVDILENNSSLKDKLTINNIAKSIESKLDLVYDDSGFYPLKKNQLGVYFEQLKKETIEYNIPFMLKFRKNVDLENFVERLFTSYPYLKSTIENKNNKICLKKNIGSVEIGKLAIGNDSLVDETVESLIKPYDVQEGSYLYRVYIIESLSNFCFFDFNHLLFDGSSIIPFIETVNKILNDENVDVDEIAFYSNILEDKKLGSNDYLKEKNFYESLWDGVDSVSELYDSNYDGSVGGEISFHIDMESLDAFCGVNNVSASNLLLSAYVFTISKFSLSDKVSLSLIVSGKTPRFSNSVGMFANTLPFAIIIDNNLLINDFIGIIQSITSKIVGGGGLYSVLDLKNDYGYQTPIAYNYRDSQLNFPKLNNDILDFMDLSKDNFNYSFDLILNIDKLENEYVLEFKYSNNYSDELINNFIRVYKLVLKEFLKNTNQKIDKLEYLDEKEKNSLLNDLNDTFIDNNPENKTVVDLFEEQVRLNGDGVALIYKDEELTYSELNIMVNRLANYLLDSYNCGGGFFVPLVLDRSPYMVVSILAVLKCGCAYVPIAPNSPRERIKHIIEDTNAELILADDVNYGFVNEIVSDTSLDLVDVESLFRDGTLGGVLSSNLGMNIGLNDPVYVIYTSGSTGNPKGVVIEHKSLYNLIFYLKNNFSINSDSVFLQRANYVFDMSVDEIFLSLASSSLLLIEQDQEIEIRYIAGLIKENNVSFIKMTPSLLNEYLEFIKIENSFITEKLRLVISGGEKLTKNIQQNFFKIFKDQQILLLDAYGPTETTVENIYKIYEKVENSVVIGKPISNTTFYILDDNQKLLPKGAIGELYLGGVGLAKEYLNNPKLTNEKFISNPYQTKKQEKIGFNNRLYKTGDLVRLNKDNDIEYIGRRDFQVKIRGYRIELGEIENTLTKIKQIKQTTVLAVDDQLIAYYSSDDEKISDDFIRNELEAYLPDYMIPTYYYHLDTMPLNNSGKVDRTRLPQPTWDKSVDYQKPKTKLEVKLTEIISQLLNIDNDNISVNDNLFRFGLDSIKAITFSNQINKEYNDKTISVKDIFQYKTIKKLAENMDKIKNYKLEKIDFKSKIEQVLSYNQESLFYINELEDEDTASYNVPYVRKLNTDVDINSLKKAILELVRRHEILSTVIKKDDVSGVFYQDQIKNKEFKISVNEYDNVKDLYEEVYNHLDKVFDLKNDYPLNVSIDVFGNYKFLVMVFHHIVTDGFSNNIINNELEKLYQYYHNNSDIYPLESLIVQYTDFAYLQKNTLKYEEFPKQFEYFNNHLMDYTGLDLPLDHVRPKYFDYKGDNIKFNIDINKINAFLKSNGISLYNFTLFAYLVLLSRYSNSNDVVVGGEIANRHIHGSEKLIGFFVNTQVIRFIFNENKTIQELFDNLMEVTDACQLNQDLPFSYLVDKLGTERNLSKNPIFQASFVFQNMNNTHNKDKDKDKDGDGGGLFDFDFNVEDLNLGIVGDTGLDNPLYAKFDLTLTVTENKDSLSFIFNYATSLFKKSTIKHFVELYRNIMDTVMDNVNVCFGDLEFLCHDEKDLLVNELNDTYVDNNPECKTVVDLFEESVECNPDKVALIYKDEELTYDELNTMVNRLANYLTDNYNCGGGFFVPLVLDRSPYMVVSILAVLKCGCAYVPIAPNSPRERIKHILKDTNAELILTDDENYGFVNEIVTDTSLDLVDVESLFRDSTWGGVLSSNLGVGIGLNDPVYVIYTSGSTGNPKGVIIEHKSLYNLIDSLFLVYGWEMEKESLLFFANYTFDASVEQIFLPLTTSSKLVISYENMWQNENEFISYLNENNVNHVNITPSFAKQIDMKKVKSLKRLVLGGEKIDNGLINKYTNQKFKLINNYGPTETTDVVSYKIYSKNMKENIIGRPIFNTTFYILDDNQKLLPKGAIGELYLGGVGLAKEYLNNPKLTNEKFISNPYQTKKQEKIGFNNRLYKTGDLVRLNEDDDLEYIGRRDFQVKIRGYRIELGEIENTLTKINQIKQAIVTINNNQLVAYYASDEKIDSKVIVNELEIYLPDYMIPHYYCYLDELPLNSSGKVDRNKLQNMEISKNENYQKPNTDLEKEIFDLCVDILGYDSFGVTNSLFNIGFSSISLITLMNKILEKYSVSLDLRELLKNNMNIQMVSKLIESTGIREYIKHKKRDYYPLTPQQLTYFHDIEKKENPQFEVIVNILNLMDVDPVKLRLAILKTIEIISDMKIYFIKINDKIYQRKCDDLGFNIEIDHSKLAEDEIKDNIPIFNLFKPPLFYFKIYHYKNETTIFSVFNHIICDGVSIENFFNVLFRVYSGENIPNGNIDYFDYVLDLEEMEKENNIKIKYYLENETKNSSLESYATIIPKKSKSVSVSANFRFIINKSSINSFCKEFNISYNNLFLAAVTLALNNLFNKNNIYLEYIFNGRDNSKYKDVFGLFRRHFPIFFDIDPIDPLKEYLRKINNKIINAISLQPSNELEKIMKFINEKNSIRVIYDYNKQSKKIQEDLMQFIYQNQNNDQEPIYYKDPINLHKDSLFVRVLELDNFMLTISYDEAYFSKFEVENIFQLIDKILNLIVNNFSRDLEHIMKLLK